MKPFVSPLIALFILLLAVWLAAHWRFRRHRHPRPVKFALYAGLFLAILLCFISTPVGSELLRATLYTRALQLGELPEDGIDFIVVLSGGWVSGRTPEEDVLNSESALRAAHAVVVARRFPSAKLIFTGSGNGSLLMRELALARGIAPERCIIEPTAAYTRAHPRAVLALDGVEADSRLVVVTSDWHLPRAKAEFDRLFNRVVYSGSSQTIKEGPAWHAWIPNEASFTASALYIKEWVGRAWSTIRRLA